MKKRIFSIMDTGRKKTGIIIFCVAIVVTFGTGLVIGANNSTTIPDSSTVNVPNLSAATNEQPNVTNQSNEQALIASTNLDAEPAPLRINSSGVIFYDNEFRWPFHAISVTNISDKSIVCYTTVSLAFDKDGNPLELYWEACNISVDGSIGSVGYDHIIVAGISPRSPKSFYHIRQHGITKNGMEWFEDAPLEDQRRWIEWITILPGQTVADERGGWSLFYGWNQSTGEHIVAHFITIVTQVTFEDGSVWVNQEYDSWLATHKGQPVQLTAEIALNRSEIPSVNIPSADLAYFEEYGITINQGNIYYQGLKIGALVDSTIMFTSRALVSGITDPHTRAYALRDSDGNITGLDLVDMVNIEGNSGLTSRPWSESLRSVPIPFSWASAFAGIEEFGITFDGCLNELWENTFTGGSNRETTIYAYYNGQPVGRLIDNNFHEIGGRNVQLGLNGTGIVYVLRDSTGNLTGIDVVDSGTSLEPISSLNFTPPRREGRGGNIMRTIIDGDEALLAYFEEYGLRVSQGNIYYNGQLVREVVFYSNYETTGLLVLKSSDTSGSITIYVLIPGTRNAMSGRDIGNYIRLDVVADN